MVTLGESISLVCPSGLSTPMSWAFGDSLVANYTTSPVSPINVVEPWKHRQWNMSITNGDLIIPEVKESDGGVYYCSHHIQVSLGGHSHDIPVSLWVIPRLHGEFYDFKIYIDSNVLTRCVLTIRLCKTSTCPMSSLIVKNIFEALKPRNW